MNEQTLKEGFTELDALAQDEYHQSLLSIASSGDDQETAVRIGRLVGVMLKEPFAEPKDLQEPSFRTRAYREWHLVGAGAFESPEQMATWQYQTLEWIRQETAEQDDWYTSISVYQLAQHAQVESGFFGYFARVVRKYICGDPEIRKKVEDALSQAKESAGIPKITPEIFMGSAGLALGAYLVTAIPALGMVGAPVIAALVVILYKLGVTAFCEWSENLNTEEAERH